ncbi:MAG TPA: SDR family oxidoreductase, partial [Longimicrobium sp.]|nr:SDR family oxidoreductase [Longimicrobium sp.]
TRGRKAFAHRRALVASNTAEAASLLRGGDASRVSSHLAAEADPGVVFLFSGLGTQYAGMGRELYDTEPAFREAMDRCFAILRERWGMDLAAVLYPADAPAAPRGGEGMDLRALLRGPAAVSESDPLQGARWGHPAMFSVGYALAELWKERGIVPRAVAGHSLGEYVAACVAGVFTLEDALTLVVRRAELLDSIPGSMAAVSLSAAETRALVDALTADGAQLWLAAENAPRSCVVSGSPEDVARFSERARAEGALVLPLAVRHPFHSGLLEPARDAFAALVTGIRRRAPEIPLAANATGQWLRPEQAQSVDYWVQHLLAPVRFAECVDTLRGLGGGAAGEPVLLEVGPGAVLGSWARQQGAARVAASLRHAEQPASDRAVLLRALGQLWSHGVAVDWTRQGDAEGRQRVVLPGHPMEPRRFWLSNDGAAPAPAAPARPAGDERRPLRDWFYAPLWRQTPAVDAPADAFRGRRVVVFGGRDAAPLADRLRAAGAEVVRVEAGGGFRDAEAFVTVDPSSPEDYHSLARSLAGRGWAGATHTLHLWSLDDAADAVDRDSVARSLDLGLHALLVWVQAQDEAGLLGEGSTLLSATRGAQPVLGSEELSPGQAPLAALLKVVAQEYTGVRGRAVDVEAHGWEAAVLAEAGALLADGGGSTDGAEPEVAYRGRARWIPFHAPTPADPRPDGGRVPLRQGGVYLVTGGLGPLGLGLARPLAEQAKARLVLTSRRGLPPRPAWDAWVAEHGEADGASRRIRAVQALEALGATVRIAVADVTDAAAMQALVDDVRAEWGGIDGVVHAAGAAAAGGLIQLKTPERLADALAPRVAGALVLHEVTEGLPLDFILLCSSLNALYGGLGAAEQAAAGAFLDAFAAWSGRDDRYVVSVGWDGTGMGARADGGGDIGISAEEGAEVFTRILQHGFGPRVAVSTRDLPAVVEHARRLTRGEVEAALRRPDGVRPVHPRPADAAPYVEPRSELEQTLADLYGRVLGIDRISADDDFFDMGGDSLLATQLLSALNEQFHVELPLRVLFGATTPARLALAIVQQQAESVDDELLAQVLAEL